MIYPEDERIQISNSVHSIGVSRDITTPSYTFPNAKNMEVEKSFLTAGLRGMGCGCGCNKAGIGGTSSDSLGIMDWLLIAGVSIFIVPHFLTSLKRR